MMVPADIGTLFAVAGGVTLHVTSSYLPFAPLGFGMLLLIIASMVRRRASCLVAGSRAERLEEPPEQHGADRREPVVGDDDSGRAGDQEHEAGG
jgi:hypothetical protein